MKTVFTPLKRQDGFTLVELMVVVAIIGLLSAVAIPNFKKYQAKSKISEAKLQLSALYTAEAAFFSDFNIYASCLRYMGFDPFPETPNRYFAVGFPDGIADRSDDAHDAAVNAGLQSEYSSSWGGGPNNIAADQCSEAGAAQVEGPYDPTHAYNPADLTTNDRPWYYAGRGMGAQILSTTALATTNLAGTAPAACERVGLDQINEFGSCVGTQENTDTMVYQASAIGFISGDFITGATAAGLNINQDKVMKPAVQGY